MAVKGIDRFQEAFTPHTGSFVLIGGAACDVWFESQALSFRSTQDLDIVLILESMDGPFLVAFRAFVDAGGYQVREKSELGPARLYRFDAPQTPGYPKMLELLSRSPDDIFPAEDQRIIPIRMTEAPSLSAILLDPDYYRFLQDNRALQDGLPVASPYALLLFKARAWLDLTERKRRGEPVLSKDIHKHRNDVFSLATSLVIPFAGTVPPRLTADLLQFLRNFPENSPEWPAISQSLQSTFGRTLPPGRLLQRVQNFFGMAVP
jgi:hypothetical protein